MTALTIENMTPVQFANSIERAVTAQAQVTDACIIAFAGKIKQAETGSLLHLGFMEMIKRNNKQKAAMDAHCKKAGLNAEQAKAYKAANRYQGLSMLQTMGSRWVSKSASHKDLGFKIKSTGEEPRIYLAKVTRPASAGKGGSTSNDKSSKTGGDRLAGFKSLDEIMQLTAQAYGIEAVELWVAKNGKAKAA